MTAGKRRVPHPRIMGRSPEDYAHELQEFIDAVHDSEAGGLPNPHGSTHDTTGADPLTTPGIPLPVVLGTAGSVGGGPAKANEGHQHSLDLATASIPDGYVLTRDSTDPRGVKWAAPAGGDLRRWPWMFGG